MTTRERGAGVKRGHDGGIRGLTPACLWEVGGPAVCMQDVMPDEVGLQLEGEVWKGRCPPLLYHRRSGEGPNQVFRALTLLLSGAGPGQAWVVAD